MLLTSCMPVSVMNLGDMLMEYITFLFLAKEYKSKRGYPICWYYLANKEPDGVR